MIVPPAALAVFDEWYDQLVHLTFDDELGQDGYKLTMAPVTDYSPGGGSSFWFDFSSYLKNLFNRRTRANFALNYCDNRSTKSAKETCGSLVIEALKKALTKLTADQGADMSAWTTPREDITFQAFGAESVEDIPWQEPRDPQPRRRDPLGCRTDRAGSEPIGIVVTVRVALGLAESDLGRGVASRHAGCKGASLC